MIDKKETTRTLCIIAVCSALSALSACGGGNGGGSDPTAAATTPGQGSTVADATSTGTIRYAQYQSTNTIMTDAGWSASAVTASTAFDAASRKGSIQFPAQGANEIVSTSDGYASVSWAGPFTSGAYRFDGNILVACDAAADDNESTRILVSSSLARVKDGMVDDLSGASFDVIDCALLKQNRTETLRINPDGSLFMSTFNSTIPKNQVFDMLNPEKYPGILINNGDFRTTGNYSGHAFRYTRNGLTRYAIAIQTSAGYKGTGSKYHSLLAIQR
jgi:hypothetical protein